MISSKPSNKNEINKLTQSIIRKNDKNTFDYIIITSYTVLKIIILNRVLCYKFFLHPLKPPIIHEQLKLSTISHISREYKL